MTEKELFKMLVERRPVKCIECEGKLKYNGCGEYECMKCKNVQYDDFGKVKKFLDENGPSGAPTVVASTGVPGYIVTELLKTGRIEIVNNSKIFIKCEKCGCSIKYGRICPECANNIVNNISEELDMVVGEKINDDSRKHETVAKMRYLRKRRQ